MTSNSLIECLESVLLLIQRGIRVIRIRNPNSSYNRTISDSALLVSINDTPRSRRLAAM